MSSKSATLAATSAAVNAVFSGKPAKKPPPVKAEPEVVPLPKAIQGIADIVAAGRSFQRIIEKKVSLAEKRFTAHAQKWWVDQYLITKQRPGMISFEGASSTLGFIQTRRVTVTPEKMDALKALGLDITPWVETTGVRINMDAVARLGYLEKLTQAIKTMVGSNAAHVKEILEPRVTVKEGFLDDLPQLIQTSLQPGEDSSRKFLAVLETLGATTQIKNAEILKTPEECFTLIMSDPKED